MCVRLPLSTLRFSNDMPGEPGADCKTISCSGELSRELSAEYSKTYEKQKYEKYKTIQQK